MRQSSRYVPGRLSREHAVPIEIDHADELGSSHPWRREWWLVTVRITWRASQCDDLTQGAPRRTRSQEHGRYQADETLFKERAAHLAKACRIERLGPWHASCSFAGS